MGALRHKIWFDIWYNKARTLQIVLIIALGAAAIGMIVGIRSLVIPTMQSQWQASDPAMVNFFVGPPLTEDELLSLKRVDGVADVEGVSAATIEWRVSPDDEWTSGQLTARADYDHQRLNKLELVSGAWPVDKRLAVEQGAEAFFGIPERGQVTLRINDREHTVTLGSTVYNQLAAPANFGGTAQFYASPDYFETMVGHKDFNQALMTADIPFDEDAVAQIADGVQDKLEKQGKESGRFITDPNKHFFQDFMDGLFFVLGVLGALALVLGLILVYNTINAIISRQVDQIGVMKAIGASTRQIFRLYVRSIMIYSLLALAIALPLGIAGAWLVTVWLVSGFNADPGSFSIAWQTVVVEVAVALIAPLLAALIPIWSGARITVREAISTYGLSVKTGLIDRLMTKARRLSRMLILTISNTFRNKWRVILMQITLVLSGLIFMMVVSVRDSVVYTINDVLFSILNYDVAYVLDDEARISRVEQVALAHPQVEAVEMWHIEDGKIRIATDAKNEDDEGVTVFGVPLPTELYGPQIRVGRWLDPQDTHAIVLNQKLAKDAGVSVGDWIVINHGGKKETRWQVVGLLFDPIITNSAHVPRDTLLRETGQTGKTNSLWLHTAGRTPEEQVAIAKELRGYFKANQLDISPQAGVFGFGGDTSHETAQTLISQFNFLIVLLGIMAVIIGVVGSIGLSGMLSLSVLERHREIGVMRAIGASSGAIARLFIGEGLLLGWLSWLIALPLGIPGGQLVLNGLAAAVQLDLVYRYTPFGAMLWLGIITVLAIAASWFPARGATRISVRESLAYQ